MLHYNYLLFDAARAEHNLYKAKELNISVQSLYKGTAEEDLEDVAPYLFDLKNNIPFEDWFHEEGWGNSWGTFLFSNQDFDQVYKHFRRFLIIRTEDGEQLYFRLYDPRVLRIFLPTCDEKQLKDFFGPIEKFAMESEDPNYAIEFELQQGNLVSKRIPKETFWKKIQNEENNVSKPQPTSFIVEPEKEEPIVKPPKPNNGWSFLVD
jgi:hypothetical protein